MKISVACVGKKVTEHFGHCEAFAVFETQGTQIVHKQMIANPGHRPGFLPVFLCEKGVDVIISGGMGKGAVDIFNEKGTEVITGVSGDADTAVSNYLQGKLKSTGSVCHQHIHG